MINPVNVIVLSSKPKPSNLSAQASRLLKSPKNAASAATYSISESTLLKVKNDILKKAAIILGTRTQPNSEK